MQPTESEFKPSQAFEHDARTKAREEIDDQLHQTGWDAQSFYVPFNGLGGPAKAYELFGDNLTILLGVLNENLAA